MPDSNKKSAPFKVNKHLQKIVDVIQNNVDVLYKYTFYTPPDTKKELENITSKVHKTLDNIVANNIDNTGYSNISSLYTRLGALQKDPGVNNKITDIMSDTKITESLMTSYYENKMLRDIDNEIDVCCKYMPELEEALETRRDNVLSSDHFSKDFLIIENTYNVTEETLFNKRIAELKENYDLLNFIDELYFNTDKYGEQFVYCVPYSSAISKLLKNKDINSTLNKVNFTENTIISESGDVFTMTGAEDDVKKELENHEGFKVILNNTNMLDAVVERASIANNRMTKIQKESLTYALKEEVITEASKKDLKIDKSTIEKDDLDYEKVEDETVSDGLYNYKKNGNLEKSDKDFEVNVPGAILKVLDRYNIIPIYIDNLCLGYYYIETFNDEFQKVENNNLADPIISMKSSTKLYNEPELAKRDNILKYISGQLSQFIDKHFVNANQDLRKEIYMILRHNDMFNNSNPTGMRVTFLPPEDVIHTYFRLDPKTHRGISGLAKSLLPAKLYAGLYITNTIAAMTRAQDRRVYYVKQNVDTNIAKVLLSTIDQIKRCNFNIRQIENINQVLNIIGRFNDFVIPTNSSGDSPVQFEIMQGQDVNPQTDLMETLKNMAVNSTDVPLELIQARQSVDYAVQLTMTNTRFLRKVFNKQAKYQVFISRIVSKLYNSEYKENASINVKLPPPMFLNISNVNQLFDNTNAMVENIVNIYIDQNDQDTNKRFIVTKNLKLHYLKTYIDADTVEAIIKKSEQEATLLAGPNEQQ